jgi:hypothetical protein
MPKPTKTGCLGLLLLLAIPAAQAAEPPAAAPNPPPSSAFEIRMGSGERNLERYRELGYTAAPLGDLGKLADYSEAATGVIPADSDLAAQIARARTAFAKSCEEAARLGISVCAGTDEVSLPTVVYDHFRQDIALENGINLESETFWTIYRAKYREVLRAFPAIAYVMIRTGENYSNHDSAYMGQTVRGRTIDDRYFTHMQRLINETRKLVVDEFGRKLIWRTWDLGNDGFHADAAVYDRILAGVTERKGLILAVKHVQTDFWAYNDFNPTIGRGSPEQIIEFQCAREYEGKGAFPNYLGAIFAADMQRARDLGAQGVWIWDFGGGWGGPKLRTDLWVRANIDAASRLAQNPSLPAHELAVAWATREFGATAAPRLAEMLELSHDCVRKTIYIEAYAMKHRGWKPSNNLLRDDIIRGDSVSGGGADLKRIYEETKTALPAVLQEKAEAHALAVRMRQLVESAKDAIVAERGETVYAEALTGLLHLEALSEVMEHYIAGMFRYYQFQDSPAPATADLARNELTAWRAAWERYQRDIPKLPAAATLYRSLTDQNSSSTAGAMADTCERALQALN